MVLHPFLLKLNLENDAFFFWLNCYMEHSRRKLRLQECGNEWNVLEFGLVFFCCEMEELQCLLYFTLSYKSGITQ